MQVFPSALELKTESDKNIKSSQKVLLKWSFNFYLYKLVDGSFPYNCASICCSYLPIAYQAVKTINAAYPKYIIMRLFKIRREKRNLIF